jgi:hypothetical protein
MWSLQQELLKAGLAGGIAVITLGLGWFVGVRITATWALRQKRRELELSAATELYRLYGEFFAVWKLWNYHREGVVPLQAEDTRWELMKRAALVDAGFETLLVKVSSERIVGDALIAEAGLLRQGFQQLRTAIKYNQPLAWHSSEDAEYSEFKRVACAFANFLARDHQWQIPLSTTSARTLASITSNEHERRWKGISSRSRAEEA